jgi:hypothetical protein
VGTAQGQRTALEHPARPAKLLELLRHVKHAGT